MDVENFLEGIKEKNWKLNTHSEASYLFDDFIDQLKESKDYIIESTLEDIEILQKMKLEENQEFTYNLFKDWLSYCLKENINKELEEDE